MANTLGETIPDSLLDRAGPQLLSIAAITPALTPAQRAAGADVAGTSGILSSAAMVDLYSQLYAQDGVAGPAAQTASSLREAYVGTSPVQPWLDAVAKVTDHASLLNALAHFALADMTAFFGWWVDADSEDSSFNSFFVAQGGITMPDRSLF